MFICYIACFLAKGHANNALYQFRLLYSVYCFVLQSLVTFAAFVRLTV